MIHHRETELAGIFHGTTHHPVILNAVTVIGEGHDSSRCQRSDGGHLLSGDAARDGPGAENIHTGLGGSFLNPGNRRRTVGHGIGIGHADHRGEPSYGGGAGPRCNGLLVRLSRLAEVDMDVDQTWSDDLTGGINDLRSLRAMIHQESTLDKNIANFIDFVGGINDASVLYVQGEGIAHVGDLAERGVPPEQR